MKQSLVFCSSNFHTALPVIELHEPYQVLHFLLLRKRVALLILPRPQEDFPAPAAHSTTDKVSKTKIGIGESGVRFGVRFLVYETRCMQSIGWCHGSGGTVGDVGLRSRYANGVERGRIWPGIMSQNGGGGLSMFCTCVVTSWTSLRHTGGAMASLTERKRGSWQRLWLSARWLVWLAVLIA